MSDIPKIEVPEALMASLEAIAPQPVRKVSELLKLLALTDDEYDCDFLEVTESGSIIGTAPNEDGPKSYWMFHLSMAEVKPDEESK